MGVKEIYGLIKLYKPDIIHSHACLSARIAGLMAGNKNNIHQTQPAAENERREKARKNHVRQNSAK